MSIKRRTAAQPETVDQDARIEAFASGADGARTRKLDPEAPRTHKKINVPFNEYEFQQLERAALKTGRSKLDYLRRAMIEQAKRDMRKK